MKKKKWKLKKLNKKTTNTIVFMFMMQFTLLGCVGMLFGMYLFGEGFHNTDLGQNMHWLEAEHNITLHDIANNEKTYDYSFVYREGMRQIDKSIIILLISCFMFTFGIAMIFGKLEYYMLGGIKNERRNY